MVSRLLLVPLGVGMVVGGGSLYRAFADEFASGGDCITSYHAQGWTLAIGEGVEIPAENVAGQPYALNTLIDVPNSQARASSAYPGFIGEAVYSLASDKMPAYPEEAEAYAPKPHQGVDADAHDYGPLMYTKAIARPTDTMAEANLASLGAVPGVGNIGPALAHVDMGYDGRGLHGLQQAAAYDVAVGPLHIGQLTSVLKWANDGTQQGTTSTWTVRFNSVEVNGQLLTSANGDGWSFQGGAPQPGPQAREQTLAQVRQLNEALTKAGVGAVDIKLGFTRNEVTPGHIDLSGTALTIRLADQMRKDGLGQAVSLQFGRTQLDVLAGRGSCDNAKPVESAYKPGELPTGPNLTLTPEPESAHWTASRTHPRMGAALPGAPPRAAHLPGLGSHRVRAATPPTVAAVSVLADRVRELLRALPAVEPHAGGGVMP